MPEMGLPRLHHLNCFNERIPHISIPPSDLLNTNTSHPFPKHHHSNINHQTPPPPLPHKMPIPTTSNENWSPLAPIYSQVERLTAPPCQTLLHRISTLLPLNTPNSSAFDNGCGTGVLCSLLKQQHPHLPLLATDASTGMIETLRRRIADEKWTNTTARVVDSRRLCGIPDGQFKHTFSTFMACLAPEPSRIMREVYRVTREGGVLGLGRWALRGVFRAVGEGVQAAHWRL